MKSLSKLRNEFLLNVGNDKCTILKKCRNCNELEKLVLDYSLDLKERINVNGIYYSIETFTSDEIQIQKDQNLIYCDKIDFLTAYFLHYIHENETLPFPPDIVFFTNCDFKTRLIREYLYDVESFDPLSLSRDIYQFYQKTKDYAFLHGEPGIEMLGRTKTGDFRIFVSSVSTFVLNDKKFIRKSVSKPKIDIQKLDETFKIQTNLFYDLLDSKWYEYLWILEYYIWMISIYFSGTTNKKWLKYFYSLFQEEELSLLKQELANLSDPTFEQIFNLVQQFQLLKQPKCE